MIIQKLNPDGSVIEFIELNDCFSSQAPYDRYVIYCKTGEYMLNEYHCMPLFDERKNNFKFGK